MKDNQNIYKFNPLVVKMLYLIGLGLGNEKDLTLNSIEVLKNCKYIYLESYTSKINFNIENLEKLIQNKIILADRNLIENKAEEILNKEKENVALLIKGDIFSATTHIDLFLRAKEKNIEIKILHNSSILTAVGDCGLSLYNFGKVSSIPFNNENIETPLKNLKNNLSLGLHSLFLLDLNNNNFMNFKEALKYLLKEISEETYCIILADLGNENIIKYGKVKDLLKLEIELYPQSVIIPGKMHFMEEEMLNTFKISSI